MANSNGKFPKITSLTFLTPKNKLFINGFPKNGSNLIIYACENAPETPNSKPIGAITPIGRSNDLPNLCILSLYFFIFTPPLYFVN